MKVVAVLVAFAVWGCGGSTDTATRRVEAATPTSVGSGTIAPGTKVRIASERRVAERFRHCRRGPGTERTGDDLLADDATGFASLFAAVDAYQRAPHPIVPEGVVPLTEDNATGTGYRAVRGSGPHGELRVVFLVEGEMVASYVIVEVGVSEYRVQGATWCGTAAAHGFPTTSD